MSNVTFPLADGPSYHACMQLNYSRVPRPFAIDQNVTCVDFFFHPRPLCTPPETTVHTMRHNQIPQCILRSPASEAEARTAKLTRYALHSSSGATQFTQKRRDGSRFCLTFLQIDRVFPPARVVPYRHRPLMISKCVRNGPPLLFIFSLDPSPRTSTWAVTPAFGRRRRGGFDGMRLGFSLLAFSEEREIGALWSNLEQGFSIEQIEAEYIL